ncbi:hypothetical protein [Roseobacter weihaiensis]|uniref:hypothetical protein n=1 Tax=Roseobacter weihaiensis TaxID=2763262 RepID=UPI001D0AAE4B|nr:hypothetical protein [Roseobacter sp. H9]
MNRRPSYRHAVEWIALEDNPGGEDPADWIAGYLTTHLVADLFGAEPRDVAEDVAKVRLANDLIVGEC